MRISKTIFFLIYIKSCCSDNENNYRLKFPNNFKIGAATSSYQIEGAWNEDGKGASIWDTFTHEHNERIVDRSNADVSANSYHFYEKDVDALKYVGVSFIC